VRIAIPKRPVLPAVGGYIGAAMNKTGVFPNFPFLKESLCYLFEGQAIISAP
jgi:hypothetical protein